MMFKPMFEMQLPKRKYIPCDPNKHEILLCFEVNECLSIIINKLFYESFDIIFIYFFDK